LPTVDEDGRLLYLAGDTDGESAYNRAIDSLERRK